MEGEEYHKMFQMSRFLETSAKDGTNVQELFTDIAKILKDSVDTSANEDPNSTSPGRTLDPSKPVTDPNSMRSYCSSCS